VTWSLLLPRAVEPLNGVVFGQSPIVAHLRTDEQAGEWFRNVRLDRHTEGPFEISRPSAATIARVEWDDVTT